ncbi:LCP family protein [Streptomyces sp. NPDC001941]|uniref:LCP family protein n=1 Tax=Streptomyces sp. NPDC001941 TaxID=3154659 RepID=UPI003321E06B
MRLVKALSPRALKWTALCLAVLVCASAAGAWALYRKLDGNIRTDHAGAGALARHGAERPRPAPGKAENILIMGSDYTKELGSERSDTVMMLHLSGDGRRADLVSIPRDLTVHIPACERPEGGHSRDQVAQFNWAYQFGRSACTIRTLEAITHVRIDHHLVVGFPGFKRLINAVGGIQVTLPHAERDPNVGLDLPAGRHLLKGDDALAYVRARQYVGDGSDVNRIGRQQDFLKLVVDKVRSGDVLTNPARLYPVLDAATSSLTADDGLDSLDELYTLVRRLRGVPPGGITFRIAPHEDDPDHWYRLLLKQPEADRLFAAVRQDRPL